MFKKIMVPIDLGKLAHLERTLKATADIANAHNAEVIFVSVYGSQPTSDLPKPEKISEMLRNFAEQQEHSHGVKASSVAVYSQDPQAELTSALLSTSEKIGADAIVMASHIPGWLEHVFHSNAGYIACHAKISVFVVR